MSLPFWDKAALFQRSILLKVIQTSHNFLLIFEFIHAHTCSLSSSPQLLPPAELVSLHYIKNGLVTKHQIMKQNLMSTLNVNLIFSHSKHPLLLSGSERVNRSQIQINIYHTPPLLLEVLASAVIAQILHHLFHHGFDLSCVLLPFGAETQRRPSGLGTDVTAAASCRTLQWKKKKIKSCSSHVHVMSVTKSRSCTLPVLQFLLKQWRHRSAAHPGLTVACPPMAARCFCLQSHHIWWMVSWGHVVWVHCFCL